jgi:hypothetical protein
MGSSEDLFTGVATRLDAATVGRYIPNGVYASTDTPIVRGGLPADPDRAIAIRVMPASADVIDPFGTFLISILLRGLPNNYSDSSDLADSVRANLLGLTDVWFGASHVVQIRFAGQIDLDEDEANRTQWSVKLLADVDEAPTNLRPAGGWD